MTQNKRKHIQRFVLGGLVVLVLSVAVVSQFVGPYARRMELRPIDFDEVLEERIPGWIVTQESLANSPELEQAVATILSFDSASFRTYKNGGVEIAIYVAYWLPGKVDKYAVEAHTPDICWVHNGWSMEKKTPQKNLEVDGVSIPVPNVRVFQTGASRLNVAFWQLSGSVLENTQSVSEAHLTFAERASRRFMRVLSAITTQPQEQLFLRISSNIALSDALDSEPARQYLRLLVRMMNGETLGEKE